ncbi:MAG: polysaccharide deacetylase family protein [Gemmatimonas sp.]|nr:polysaccharide deacetylase family protein [Gemmatimonas sp.]
MRKTLKRLGEPALSFLLANSEAISRRRGRVLILAYHNIVPSDSHPTGDVSMHLPFEEFVRQLDLLERHCDVVPLMSLCEKGGTASTRPRVVITFDDAYVGAVTWALPELARRRMPSTVFVSPGFLDHKSFWWDHLANPITGVLAPGIRQTALEKLSGKHEDVMKWASENKLTISEVPAFARGSAVVDLYRASELFGVSFAPHTWSHPNLSRISRGELEHEIHAPLAWLNEHFGGRVVPALAHPYGLFGEETELVARDAGIRLTLRVEGGWCESEFSTDLPLPRLNVASGLSTAGFRLRLAGIL